MYQPNSELAKLRDEKKKAEQEKTQWEHRGQRLANRIRYYTEGEGKKRNHRLITRGAAVESIVPRVREMGEVEFYSLAEKIFSVPAVMKIVNAHCRNRLPCRGEIIQRVLRRHSGLHPQGRRGLR